MSGGPQRPWTDPTERSPLVKKAIHAWRSGGVPADAPPAPVAAASGSAVLEGRIVIFLEWEGRGLLRARPPGDAKFSFRKASVLDFDRAPLVQGQAVTFRIAPGTPDKAVDVRRLPEEE
jgi:hypothetical protein